jgi:hypothetical protein
MCHRSWPTLEVYNEFELGRLLDRQIGGLLTFEYAADVDAGLAIHIGDTRSVAGKASSLHKFVRTMCIAGTA